MATAILQIPNPQKICGDFSKNESLYERIVLELYIDPHRDCTACVRINPALDSLHPKKNYRVRLPNYRFDFLSRLMYYC